MKKSQVAVAIAAATFALLSHAQALDAPRECIEIKVKFDTAKMMRDMSYQQALQPDRPAQFSPSGLILAGSLGSPRAEAMQRMERYGREMLELSRRWQAIGCH